MLIYVPVLITCQAGQRKRVAANVFGRASNRSSLHGRGATRCHCQKPFKTGVGPGHQRASKVDLQNNQLVSWSLEF